MDIASNQTISIMQTGSKVICINDSNYSSDAKIKFNKLPKKGRIYTVRRLQPNYERRNGPDGVLLEGFYGKNLLIQNFDGTMIVDEYSFKMLRFRELQPEELKLLENSYIEYGVKD